MLETRARSEFEGEDAMKGTYTALMQSRFFNPAFNSAIFDGPIRIYFAQFHESLALKIYFCLQQKFVDEMARAKELHRQLDRNVLVMLYPSQDSFKMSFEGADGFIAHDDLSSDIVIGINGPFEDEKLSLVLDEVVLALKSWEKIPVPKGFLEATL